jgi:heme/copper-type cytochrome/quinol oxidase subunit 2
MKEKTGKPDFVYEISCDQMCGKGHWSMRGEIVVETQEEFDAWMINKKRSIMWLILIRIRHCQNQFRYSKSGSGNTEVKIGPNIKIIWNPSEKGKIKDYE